jgi:adenylate cyclase
MRYQLVGISGSEAYMLRDDRSIVVGRASSSDVSLNDPTISRRHAELRCDAAGVSVQDLGSRNGTFHNGVRVESARLVPGDVIAFGGVALTLAAVTGPPPAPERPVPLVLPPRKRDTAPERFMPPAPVAGLAVAEAEPAAPDPDVVAERRVLSRAETADDAGELTARKLALLLDVAKGLGRPGDVGARLEQIVAYVFQTLAADRASILLLDEDGALVAEIERDRWGGDLAAGTPRPVPRSIAQAAVQRRSALLSINAADDPRFTGQSIVRQRVRSAMCAPLLSSDGRALGVLYVDNIAATHQFDEGDLDFLAAFAGIAGAALENGQLAERLRREAVARGNFERYFAPQLAARIAASSEPVRLGGERRTVAVLFGDLRGFTALSATLAPDDVAAMLSEYLSAMVDCVFRHAGTLDKFIGDAVMAQWGAPHAADDDADRAMQAALDMLDSLERLNATWRAAGRATAQMGIGLSYGEVFAGNIGSERRLEFTVIGDVVNVASRLCDVAAPGEILLTDAMRRALSAAPSLRQLPTPRVPGAPPAAPLWAVDRPRPHA